MFKQFTSISILKLLSSNKWTDTCVFLQILFLGKLFFLGVKWNIELNLILILIVEISNYFVLMVLNSKSGSDLGLYLLHLSYEALCRYFGSSYKYYLLDTLGIRGDVAVRLNFCSLLLHSILVKHDKSLWSQQDLQDIRCKPHVTNNFTTGSKYNLDNREAVKHTLLL